jgi:nucleoside-diphosphate-sugar epimerase
MTKKVLLTGAFGNVGTSTLEELIKRDHIIRCFDVPTKKTKRIAKKYRKQVEIIWGDIRNEDVVKKAADGMDVIIHLAAIIPPLAHKKPELAQAINVGGTRNILKAAQEQIEPPKLIYSSSVSVYGDVRRNGKEIIKTTHPYNPSPNDNYARTKIACEQIIKDSNLQWAIFRFAAIPPVDLKVDPLMYEVPLDTPLEFCHTSDTGLALAKAVDTEEVWGETFHIGGGPECRVPYKEYVGKLLEAFGIGRLPEEAFGTDDFHCGYLDTTKSQELLEYQRHTFEDLIEENRKRMPFLRWLVVIFRPIVRHFLLKKSPYYIQYKNQQKIKRRYSKKSKKKISAKEKGTSKTKKIIPEKSKKQLYP